MITSRFPALEMMNGECKIIGSSMFYWLQTQSGAEQYQITSYLLNKYTLNVPVKIFILLARKLKQSSIRISNIKGSCFDQYFSMNNNALLTCEEDQYQKMNYSFNIIDLTIKQLMQYVSQR